jgi:hypothetical protein
MQLIKRKSRRDAQGQSRPMSFSFDDFFAPFWSDRRETGSARWQPVVDIIRETRPCN